MKTFVEIGCCDFDTLRPLCDKGWSGVMIDPYRPYLDNIEDHKNLTKINLAVALYEGSTEYTRINDSFIEEKGDYFHKGMGTITNITTIKSTDYFEGYLETHKVETITFDKLMTKLGITEIDYLKIDTEGMDFDILKSIDYNKYKINLIKMEHSYCDEKLVIQFLTNNGYHCELFPDDIMAIKK